MSNCRVFVGNIPYEATREELVGVFSRVGHVVDFKLISDRDKKPRGYGFCEFSDPMTAQTALHTMNGVQLHGRPLRVDHADADKSGSGQSQGPVLDSYGYAPQMYGNAYGRGPQGAGSYGAPPPPPGAYGGYAPAPPAGVLEVNEVVERMQPRQLAEVIERARALAQSNPEGARKLLGENPQLAFALLQAHVSLGLIDSNTAQAMLVVAQQGPPPPPPPQVQQAAPVPVQMQVVPPPPPQVMMQPPPTSFYNTPPPPPGMVGYSQPPQVQQMVPPPPPPIAQQQQQQDMSFQADLWNHVAQMTQDQIEKLPPQERQQVLLIRQTMMSGAKF
eukprot:m51a1_g2497 putative cleavage stimulation factor (331) ;mRNA; f:119302-120566